MPSTPLICSSIGAATVSAITFGLAPGYCARTTTDGGTTSGYSEIGICRSARRPATKISTDRTPAKIGRSMKNLDTFMSRPPCSSLRLGGCSSARDGAGHYARLFLGAAHRHHLGCEQRPGADALQTVHDDALARGEAVSHPAQPVDEHAERHFAVRRL